MRKSYCEISTVNRITLWGEWIVTSLFAASPNSDLTALPITEGGTAIREQRTLTERIRKAADHFIKTPTIQSNHRSDHIFHYINHLIKKKERKRSEVKWRHLLKCSKLWKATMAPILWQGGDSAPSRKSSLPWRRIVWNSPVSFIGADNLRGERTVYVCECKQAKVGNYGYQLRTKG